METDAWYDELDITAEEDTARMQAHQAWELLA